LQAGADTNYEAKRRMLAKALAGTARYPASIDEAMQVIENVKALERNWSQVAERLPHLRWTHYCRPR
jgi:hypothetical protein